MKIVNIFANKLFAFQYKGEKYNELRRLLNLWSNTSYLLQFTTENKTDIPKNKRIEELIFTLIENANKIDAILNEIKNNPDRRLEDFFKNLNNNEYRIDILLAKQKGRQNFYRIYALKIDNNCFVITGGAIKFHHLNKNRPHTQIEMQKIDQCRDYLKENGVIDSDSFYEFLNEGQ